MTIAGRQVRASNSVGATAAAGPVPDLDRLLHEADVALYAAKAAGKCVVCRYENVAVGQWLVPHPLGQAAVARYSTGVRSSLSGSRRTGER